MLTCSHDESGELVDSQLAPRLCVLGDGTQHLWGPGSTSQEPHIAGPANVLLFNHRVGHTRARDTASACRTALCMEAVTRATSQPQSVVGRNTRLERQLRSMHHDACRVLGPWPQAGTCLPVMQCVAPHLPYTALLARPLTATAPLPLSCTSTTCAVVTTVAAGGRGALSSRYCSPWRALP